MSNTLTQLDPQRAWSPYEPTSERPWNRARAAHLFRRVGFGGNRAELDAALEKSPAEVVRSLVRGAEPAQFQDDMESLAQAMVNTGQVQNLSAVWLHRMIATPHPVLEKLTLFWHGHFATSAAKVQDAAIMWRQNRLLRRHALGRFGALVQDVSRDPAMLLYLDSDTNRKSHPNENYARELLELFCLGEGNYTEHDIRELARCFTGWQVKRQQFRFSRYQHDAGAKTIFGTTAAMGGEEAVDVVLSQPAAPRFVAAKLVRFLVADAAELPPALVEPLARQLRENDFEIAPVLERIVGSELFFSAHALGGKIRSPVELACGLLRTLEGSANTIRLAEQLGEVGQALFFPPNVKGWDGGRAWINSATLLGRANLVYDLVHHEKTRYAGGSLADFVENHGIDSGAAWVDWLEEQLLAVPLPREARERLSDLAGGDAQLRGEQLAEVIHALSTLPEFQLL